jgi:DNA-binding LacI/PurR family transcriptional regulator
MIALGILLALREAGLRCPQDISVMGFDDLDLAEVTNPSLVGFAIGLSTRHDGNPHSA